MKRILALATLWIVLTACVQAPAQPRSAPVPTATPPAGMPNPASVFCEEHGNQLEIRTAADGSQSGVCVFPDGSRCDEWAYYRGECQPGTPAAYPLDPSTPAAARAAPDGLFSVADDGCNLYTSPEFGYSFHYPAGAILETNDDPTRGFSIVGPSSNGESWPLIGISHPRDREEYRPPEDTDLLQWLGEHALLGDTRQQDVRIAGTTAIHLRHDRSPHSYASDQYYFARAGQLYQLSILHTGDREDWGIYNHFLESIDFEPAETATPAPPEIPTALPLDPAGYQGWWRYTHTGYGFSIMLPEDWVVEEITTFDPLMNGHMLNLHPQDSLARQNIRMTFRRAGEAVILWPGGVGQGEFIPQETLDVDGQPAQRVLLVCPSGEVTSIWYLQGEGQPEIVRGGLEFGFIFTAASHCEAGYSLGGKVQRVGEMIIASLKTS